ncbi:MAG: choice-of-anchor J domain-containing protein [Bacteroidales bacterium]|nr:choice-of-anchor J domain-containing protein [Bacteroidales bacterium]
MRKPLFFLIIFLMFSAVSFGQGNETFANYPETGNAYHDGTFLGLDGSTWTYTQCRGDSVIVAPSPTFGKKRPITSKIISGTIHNGCGTISFDFKQPFSTAANLNLFVNGLLVKNVVTTTQGVLENSGPIVVNAPGDFTLMFKQADSSNSGQVTIDNVIWTAYSGGPVPEPTNYPTSFVATPSPFSINLSWVDAVGVQLPAAYLILASDQDNIVAPVDGTPVPDDANLADGHGALNVPQGIQHATFANLPGNKQFFFKIYPYTNSGTLIDYKNDGTAPSANATTPNTTVINSQNFNNYSLSPWVPYNVIGAQVWTIDSIHGLDGGPCAKASGYSGGSNENEDWLISPAMNFNLYYNELMTFQSAYKYAGPALEAFISNDYDGSTDPNDFIWIPLTATWSSGNWVWTSSGNVNLSGVSGPQVYVAFKYLSSTTESATWELDDIVITGDLLDGVNENSAQNATFTVYPNPSSIQCTVGFASSETREIKLLSVIGSVVFETITNQQNYKLNLQHFSKGIYFIQVHNVNGNTTQVKKLIVQ